MTKDLRRKLMIGLAIAAVVAGVLVAVAPKASHGHRSSGGALHRGHHRKAGGRLELAAGYLGLSRSELHHSLLAGKTLAQVAARTPGKSSDGLVKALLAPRATHLKDRKLSPGAEHERLATLRARIVEEVNKRRTCCVRLEHPSPSE